MVRNDMVVFHLLFTISLEFLSVFIFCGKVFILILSSTRMHIFLFAFFSIFEVLEKSAFHMEAGQCV